MHLENGQIKKCRCAQNPRKAVRFARIAYIVKDLNFSLFFSMGGMSLDNTVRVPGLEVGKDGETRRLSHLDRR